MKQIQIGNRIEDGQESAVINLDVDALIRTKALIQGNSGAGKSGLIRVIVEQVAARVPTIIFDPESEFASLRETLDMVLVGHQGELAADVRSAGLLARKLAEMGASAILDIYELKGDQRHQFVKAYLEAQIDLPRKLWRPTVVVIDEAQLFAPEKGFGDSLALDAIMDWMFRQRKHGIGSILATPRLSMLNKNVAGANNIFIGRTQLDTDQQRAGKALGMSNKEAVGLRDLKGRQFFCYGPALNVTGVTLFRVRDCETTIPEPGVHKHLAPPKASHVVAQIADKLKDIKQEAEAEIRTLSDAKAEVAKLKHELRQAKSGAMPREQDTKRIAELEAKLQTTKGATRTETKIVEKRVVIEGSLTRLEALASRYEKAIETARDVLNQAQDVSTETGRMLDDARHANEPFQKPQPLESAMHSLTRGEGDTLGPRRVPIKTVPAPRQITSTPQSTNGNSTLTKGELAILRAIVQFGSVSREQVSILCDYKATSRNEYLRSLIAKGKVVSGNGEFQATDEGIAAAGEVDLPPSGEELIAWWSDESARRLSQGERVIFQNIVAHNGQVVSREMVRDATGYKATSTNEYIRQLAARKLVVATRDGVKAADFLFREE